MKQITVLIGVCLLVLTPACGYLAAGTWENDPKNWTRAFNESRPADGIEIVHSWYRRMPHWTAEFAWFFELKMSASARAAMFANPQVHRRAAFTKYDFEQHLASP